MLKKHINYAVGNKLVNNRQTRSTQSQKSMFNHKILLLSFSQTRTL